MPQAVIQATDLRTPEQVARLVDSAILIQAFDNDARQPPQPSPLARTRRPRPRRLVADAALLQRRAAGEPLRQLARDYHVAHTTLSRYFARTELRRQFATISTPAPTTSASTRSGAPTTRFRSPACVNSRSGWGLCRGRDIRCVAATRDSAARAAYDHLLSATAHPKGATMSDPKEQQRESDELELESETIADLEVKEQEEEEVRGGCINGSCWNTKPL